MSDYYLVCKDGEIFLDGAQPSCTGSWVQQIVVVPKTEEDITPEIVLQYFSAGFFLCTTPLMAALGFRYLLSLLRS